VNALTELKLRLRDKAEHHLRVAAMERLRGDAPSTVAPYRERGGRFWQAVFVPLYQRVPWTYKRRAMDAAKMTARGWTPPAREPGEPWRPPATRR
jgi:hypothetical protein